MLPSYTKVVLVAGKIPLWAQKWVKLFVFSCLRIGTTAPRTGSRVLNGRFPKRALASGCVAYSMLQKSWAKSLPPPTKNGEEEMRCSFLESAGLGKSLRFRSASKGLACARTAIVFWV